MDVKQRLLTAGVRVLLTANNCHRLSCSFFHFISLTHHNNFTSKLQDPYSTYLATWRPSCDTGQDEVPFLYPSLDSRIVGLRYQHAPS
jgi:hypothetical protein